MSAASGEPFIDEYIPDREELLAATTEEPFVHAAFEFLKEASVVLAVAVGLRRPGQEDGVGRNQAIVLGLFARCIKLMKALIRQLVDGHGGDMQVSINREVLESLSTVLYLLADAGDGARYDSYVFDSLIAEREFRKDVEAQIAARGSMLPIEERILRSIDETFAAAGVTSTDVPARRNNGWPSAESRVAVFGPVAYSAYRAGSNAVHGAFADLEKNHFDRNGNVFEINLDPPVFRPQPLLMTALIALDAAQVYVAVWLPEAIDAFNPKVDSIRRRLVDVDNLHEAFLQKRGLSELET